MNKHQEKVLVATLCGLVITAAGAFAVQPAMAKSNQPVTIPVQHLMVTTAAR
ncbi:MAG: hypothetical protein JWQ22_1704 [Devosia sp.]|nr:hypothetical protein [Devosia sp.]